MCPAVGDLTSFEPRGTFKYVTEVSVTASHFKVEVNYEKTTLKLSGTYELLAKKGGGRKFDVILSPNVATNQPLKDICVFDGVVYDCESDEVTGQFMTSGVYPVEYKSQVGNFLLIRKHGNRK